MYAKAIKKLSYVSNINHLQAHENLCNIYICRKFQYQLCNFDLCHIYQQIYCSGNVVSVANLANIGQVNQLCECSFRIFDLIIVVLSRYTIYIYKINNWVQYLIKYNKLIDICEIYLDTRYFKSNA